MSESNIITQAGLSEVKFNLQQVAENLSEHVNASLSKAHSINIVDGYTDTDGNDRTTYQNANGTVVGNKQLRFNVGGAVYYAPCNLSGEGGQASTNGELSTGTTAAEFAEVGKAAWVTDFLSESAASAEDINTSFLLPHTLRKHEEVHGNFTVIAEDFLDANGILVGEYKVRWVVNGVRYAIPASTRIGGPLQPVRLAAAAINTMEGTDFNYCAMGRDDNQFGYFWYNDPIGGGSPSSFVWQYNDYQPVATAGGFWRDPLIGSGTWYDMPAAASPTSMASNFQPTFYSTQSPNKLTIQSNYGNDSQAPMAVVRGKWTNPAGNVYTNWCIFLANDTDGSWIFNDPDTNQSATHVDIINDPVLIGGFYTPPGAP